MKLVIVVFWQMDHLLSVFKIEMFENDLLRNHII